MFFAFNSFVLRSNTKKKIKSRKASKWGIVRSKKKLKIENNCQTCLIFLGIGYHLIKSNNQKIS